MIKKLSFILPALLILLIIGQAQAAPFSYSDSGTPLLSDIDVAAPGKSTSIIVTDSGIITDLDVSVEMAPNWNTAIDIQVMHVDTGTTVHIFDSPGDSLGHIDATFDDEAAGTAPQDGSNVLGVVGPHNPLSAFDGEDIFGEWKITFTDNTFFTGDGDDLLSWGISGDAVATNPVPEPSTYALFAIGAAAVGIMRRRKNKV